MAWKGGAAGVGADLHLVDRERADWPAKYKKSVDWTIQELARREQVYVGLWA